MEGRLHDNVVDASVSVDPGPLVLVFEAFLVASGLPIFPAFLAVFVAAYFASKTWIDVYGGRLYIASDLPFTIVFFLYDKRYYVGVSVAKKSLPALGLGIGYLPVYLMLAAFSVVDLSGLIPLFMSALVAVFFKLKIEK